MSVDPLGLCTARGRRRTWRDAGLFFFALARGGERAGLRGAAQNRRYLKALYGQNANEVGYANQLLASSIAGQFFTALAVNAPFADGPEQPLLENEGDGYGLVLEGELAMPIGYELILLRGGDSCSLDARTPHYWRNRTDQERCLTWAVSPVVIPKDVLRTAPPEKDDRA
ncbi:cupin domain-containing protein [Roseobacter sp.]|uniref:cupin domain-containing protein n=1 Tax=Roseobacter sp. TaxID=1907202 RepID=UPI00385C7E3D